MQVDLPSVFSTDLTEERLQILSERVLDTIQDSLDDTSTADDTAWTRGCMAYGRLQGMVMRLSRDRVYPWLSLANNTMDFTVKVGSTHLQFLIDDAYSPRKTHRLRTNSVESNQLSILLEDSDNAKFTTWRLFVGFKNTDEGDTPFVTVVGYDINQIEICRWEHDDVVMVPVSADIVGTVEIDVPELSRKSKKDVVKNEAK